MLVKTKVLTEIFDCNKSTITAWKRLGLADASKGRDKWDLREAILWWVEHIYTGPAVAADDPATLAAAKLQYWQARGERERRRSEIESGKWLDAEEVKEASFNCARSIRDAMLGVPERISDQLAVMSDAFQVRTLLRGEIRQALITECQNLDKTT